MHENQEENPNNGTETINSFMSQEDMESSDYEDDDNLHFQMGKETPATKKNGLRMIKTTVSRK